MEITRDNTLKTRELAIHMENLRKNATGGGFPVKEVTISPGNHWTAGKKKITGEEVKEALQ